MTRSDQFFWFKAAYVQIWFGDSQVTEKASNQFCDMKCTWVTFSSQITQRAGKPTAKDDTNELYGLIKDGCPSFSNCMHVNCLIVKMISTVCGSKRTILHASLDVLNMFKKEEKSA